MIEVISESSRRFDSETKLRDYERLGVFECWLLDPQKESTRFYRLEDGQYRSVAAAKKHFASKAVPGVRLNLDRVRRAFRGM